MKITNLDFYNSEARHHLFEAMAYCDCARLARKGRCGKLQQKLMRMSMRDSALRAVKAVREKLVRDQRSAA